MNEKRYQEYLARGTQILQSILPELNKLSEQHTRKDNTFRREEDFNEIAVALALYDDRIEACLV
jgi:hypothetical protein